MCDLLDGQALLAEKVEGGVPAYLALDLLESGAFGGQAAAQAKRTGVTWRSFWNGPLGTSGPIASKWGVTSWPTIYVLDHRGVIRFRGVRGADMDAAVDQLLGELEAGK